MPLKKTDIDTTVSRYTERYRQFGYSPKTLGWDKGKQDLRFAILTSAMDPEERTMLDIGCGFGDLISFLDRRCGSYHYVGIDLVPQLIETAKERHPQHEFFCGDFLSSSFRQECSYAVGSGIFNFKLKEGDNYDYIDAVIGKALRLSSLGVAFDFLSDKVDYRYEHTFHSSPSRVLDIAYQYSKNIVLRNDYMPFEFSVFITKDMSFDKSDTIFTEFKKRTGLSQ
ncbi:MAG: class I SAM-dependent methyltransferase [Acidobacteriota bacterium]